MTENAAYENTEPTYENVEHQSTSFSSRGNAEEVEKDKSAIPAPYAGMPKDVLLHYSRQKKFVWARHILAGAVILTILVLLSMVIALIAVSPACQQFWQTSPIYQVYPKSFKDSNNNGTGDLIGIKDKLDYLANDLGVTTVWLNPIYKSPQADNGYDVSDYRAIDPIFGSMKDFEDLVTALHNKGMQIVMDFVPNHSSNQHAWFQASSDTGHPDFDKYKDYYVWVNSTNGTASGVPNNWQSVFSDREKSAWEWSDNRKQFYYHAFLKEQPDLNLRNLDVQEELKGILSYWMDHGVDGFRCDALKYMFEATHLRDNPVKNPSLNPLLSYDNMWPDYTENQFGIHDVVADWRTVLKQYSTEPGVYRFMETEVYDSVDTVVRYYGTPLVKEADFPMNFQLIDLKTASWTASAIESTVMEWMQKMPKGKWPNWVLGNHDNSRIVSRLDLERAKLAIVLSMTLSGTPGIYYGEEIGMIDSSKNTPEIVEDFRNPERTPMQWSSNTSTGGFCDSCNPWLPVNDDVAKNNVEAQLSDKTSMLWLYKTLIAQRSEVSFLRGSLCVLHSTDKSFLYVREMPGSWSTLIAINFDLTDQDTINLYKEYNGYFPTSGTKTFNVDSPTQTREAVEFNNVIIEHLQAIMVSFKPPGNALFSNSEWSSRCFVSHRVCINVMGLLEVC